MDDLINSGNELLTATGYSKAKFDIWKMRAERTIARDYDDGVAQEFHRIFNRGSIIRPGMDIYREIHAPRIRQGIEFLVTLARVDMPTRKDASTTSAPHTMTINGGTVVYGDNASVHNVTVRDVLITLENEIEATDIPDDKKRDALGALRSITSNETIASVIGTSLGAFLGSLK